MALFGPIDNINSNILIQCREQIGLELSEVEKKIKNIAKFEKGEIKPTFKQLNKLAEIYKVPRWVFISDHLPEKYQFKKSVPAFRQFINSKTAIFKDHKIRSITAKIEQFRKFIIELREDMGEPIEPFNAPPLKINCSPIEAANIIRKWLNINVSLDFKDLKKLLENKGIFIFLTSKYNGWSHIEKYTLRGLAIYHSILPIIIINDSDAKKAQSFTLFHELAHLLKKENALDDWNYHNRNNEKWCDEFSGNILMPKGQMQFTANEINNLDAVKKIAQRFKTSTYACLVRLRQLEIISPKIYTNFETQLKEEYKKFQKLLKEKEGGPARNRAKEIINQYGRICTTTFFQAYHNQEIGLHKLTRLFDLKKTSYVFDMEWQL
jgi:Zn-dependent peptidase ImmA (M78 family)